MSHCTNCGAPLAPDARFCPKCGTAVAVAPVAAPPPEAPVPQSYIPPAAPGRVAYTPAPPPVAQNTAGRGAWWIVPLIIIAIVLIAWLLLAGLPFGRRDQKKVVTAPATETIAEGTAPPAQPQSTGTIVDVTETAPPPLATETAPPPAQSTASAQIPAPVVVEEPAAPAPSPVQSRPAPVIPRPAPVTPRPAPVTPAPAPVRTEPAGEITGDEAAATVRGFITSRNYYSDVAAGCVQVRNQGYRNVGYTFTVWDACVNGGGSRMLGRWRVDAKTREVFRQQDDGRYQRP
jgi:hypothetical protein